MIKNICPFCGSKEVKEMVGGYEKKDTKSRVYVPGYITDNINRDFYCFTCRKAYNTDDLKRKAEYDKKKFDERIVMCIIFK